MIRSLSHVLAPIVALLLVAFAFDAHTFAATLTHTAAATGDGGSSLLSWLGGLAAAGAVFGAVLTPQQQVATAKAINARFGRFQGPELFYSANVDLSAPSQVLVPRPLNLTRPATDLYIRVRGRAAVTVANYTAVSPEAIYNILQNVRITGTHRTFGQLTPINQSGASIYAWPFHFQRAGGSQTVNNTETAQPGRPQASGFAGSTAGSPYDFDIVYWIPLRPLTGPSTSSKREGLNFAWMPGDWQDTIQIQLAFGDKSALGDPTGATVAFTAFGSGAGTPTYEIHTNYTIFSPEFAAQQRQQGVVIRNEITLNGFTAAALATRLLTLQKQITTNMMLKSGIAQTAGLTAGVFTYASLSDLILDKTQISVDNKPIRNNQANIVMKAYLQDQFGCTIPQGSALLSFVDGGKVALAYRGDQLPGGSDFALVSDITSSVAANHTIRATQEMVYGGPFG
jgi:hypothetical protein